MKMRTLLLPFALVFLALVPSRATESDEAAVASTVDAFHAALKHDDGKAAMSLLAPDALILESGAVETRGDYEAHHLPEDIRFARTVPAIRSEVRVRLEGNTAWLTSRSIAEGSFEGKPVNSAGVELVILTRTADGWRIRAIHWSSRKTKPAQ